MPTTYTIDGWYTPAGNTQPGTTFTPTTVTLVDQNDDGLFSENIDTINGETYGLVISGTIWQNGTPTNAPSEFSVFNFGSDNNGGLYIFPNDNTPVTSTFYGNGATGSGPNFSTDFIELDVICFCRNTMIRTDRGNIPVQKLTEGMLIKTRDNGMQPIRWIGRRLVDDTTLARNPKLRPIRIKKGAMGCGLPERDLFVSRQHRMVVSSQIAQRLSGSNDVFVPAIKLIGIEGIELAEDTHDVEYFHILFDHHEVIYAEGAPSESLMKGPQALKFLEPEALEEVHALFPDLYDQDFIETPALAILEGKAQKQLIARHIKNNKPLLSQLSAMELA